jgi:uncharacterized membrane protein YqjE
MDDTPPTENGALSAAKRLIQTLHDIAENRVELFLVELKEERARFFDTLLLAAVGIVCALMTLVMLTLTVVVVFWDTHRLLVLVTVTVVYAAAAAAAFIAVRARLQRWRAFSETLEQIKKDRSCLGKPN